ncbi:MAG: hypothetical protein Q9227_002938 [Pyrenula ochraceoflavens]
MARKPDGRKRAHSDSNNPDDENKAARTCDSESPSHSARQQEGQANSMQPLPEPSLNDHVAIDTTTVHLWNSECGVKLMSADEIDRWMKEPYYMLLGIPLGEGEAEDEDDDEDDDDKVPESFDPYPKTAEEEQRIKRARRAFSIAWFTGFIGPDLEDCFRELEHSNAAEPNRSQRRNSSASTPGARSNSGSPRQDGSETPPSSFTCAGNSDDNDDDDAMSFSHSLDDYDGDSDDHDYEDGSVRRTFFNPPDNGAAAS